MFSYVEDSLVRRVVDVGSTQFSRHHLAVVAGLLGRRTSASASVVIDRCGSVDDAHLNSLRSPTATAIVERVFFTV
jgi:hypothetical protein